jgi:membrane associated rhomboid family serine protease
VAPHSRALIVGGSGAIAGVMAAFVLFAPCARITALNPIIILWIFTGPLVTLDAWVMMILWFAWNLIEGVSRAKSIFGEVAYFAHIGGFAVGLFITHTFRLGRPRQRTVDWNRWRRKSLFSRASKWLN